MQMLFRLFGPRRRKNQEEIAGRAAEVIVHVLFDVGLDRFLAGTMLLDREFRVRFYAVAPQRSPAILASVAVCELVEAQAFREGGLSGGGGPPGADGSSFAGRPGWAPRFGAGGIAPYPSGCDGGGGGVGVVIGPLPEYRVSWVKRLPRFSRTSPPPS